MVQKLPDMFQLFWTRTYQRGNYLKRPSAAVELVSNLTVLDGSTARFKTQQLDDAEGPKERSHLQYIHIILSPLTRRLSSLKDSGRKKQT
jgi:hypothetical protein